jgi:anaerobic magnesium-protoporphyrin IX monomethyl ester cyclase
MKKRILLIEPPFLRLYKDSYSLDRYPLSLGYLSGAILNKTDWEVKVFNADFSPERGRIKVSFQTGEGFVNYLNSLRDISQPIWREISDIISGYSPDVVGISVKSQNYISAANVAKLAKAISKEIIVIVGGPHPSMVGCDIFECEEIDIGVKGEGEETIAELLQTIERGRDLDGIKGIVFRKDGECFDTPPRPQIEDLDSLTFPHETAPTVLMDYDKYPLAAFKNIFATRGCPYGCFFCGSRHIWGQKVRFRSPENVVREIGSLQRMGLKAIHFDDDTFGINKSYIRSLLGLMMQECNGLKWSCELHVKLVDDEIIRLMKKAGCYLIQVGVESGNNQILKEMRKNITIEEALRACDVIRSNRIEVQTFFIVGFPQETEQTLNDTFDAIKRIKSDSLIYSIFTPYPGTEASRTAKPEA